MSIGLSLCLAAAIGQGVQGCKWNMQYAGLLAAAEPAHWEAEAPAARAADKLLQLLLASSDRRRFHGEMEGRRTPKEQVLLEAIMPRAGEYVAVWAYSANGAWRVLTMKKGVLDRRPIEAAGLDEIASLVTGGVPKGHVNTHALDSALVFVSYDLRGHCRQIATMEPVLAREKNAGEVLDPIGRGRDLILAILGLLDGEA